MKDKGIRICVVVGKMCVNALIFVGWDTADDEFKGEHYFNLFSFEDWYLIWDAWDLEASFFRKVIDQFGGC